MNLDAGMGINYFDEEVVRLAMRPEDKVRMKNEK